MSSGHGGSAPGGDPGSAGWPASGSTTAHIRADRLSIHAAEVSAQLDELCPYFAQIEHDGG